jgi:hypothetical protein
MTVISDQHYEEISIKERRKGQMEGRGKGRRMNEI